MIKTINDNLYFECETYSNYRSWGHRGRVFYNGVLITEHKIRYYNRTWERYQFESLLFGLVHKMDILKNVPLAERILAYKIIKA